MKGDWFNFFSGKNMLLFDVEAFEDSMKALKEDLPVYLRYAKEGARMLECCCGPGYTAVPLSHYFDVTAFDRDEDVLENARRNAERFGKRIKFEGLDFFDIKKKFGKDSFDACSSGGVLEHFAEKDIRKLVDLQLEVAPIAFASMPLADEGGGKPEVNEWGIARYAYGEEDWANILKAYNVLERRRLPTKPEKMMFREFITVIGRGK